MGLALGGPDTNPPCPDLCPNGQHINSIFYIKREGNLLLFEFITPLAGGRTCQDPCTFGVIPNLAADTSA